MSALGVIGGTGLAALDGFEVERQVTQPTPWGEPSAALLCGRFAGHAAVFLARHGSRHDIPPHAVNYRANLWALREAGVGRIIAVNAVGGIAPHLAPGTLAVPDQIIDYTWGRQHTYSDGGDRGVQHVDFTRPYSDMLRALLLAAGARAGIELQDGGVYAATQGPRLESAAEIDRLARDGCHMVGMTGMPEAGLARELDLEYACCAVVVNRAAGRGGDIHGELARWVETGMAQACRLLQSLCAGLGDHE